MWCGSGWTQYCCKERCYDAGKKVLVPSLSHWMVLREDVADGAAAKRDIYDIKE